MYFPNHNNQGPNFPPNQVNPYPQNTMFMYPAKIQPYNNEQFLYKTFNFKFPYIEAFLSLPHQQKLRFYMLIEERRLTGQMSQEKVYKQILNKILLIVNPDYVQQQQPQYKPVTDEQIKKKILENQVQTICNYELRKLGVGDKNEQQEDQFSEFSSSTNQQESIRPVNQQFNMYASVQKNHPNQNIQSNMNRNPNSLENAIQYKTYNKDSYNKSSENSRYNDQTNLHEQNGNNTQPGSRQIDEEDEWQQAEQTDKTQQQNQINQPRQTPDIMSYLSQNPVIAQSTPQKYDSVWDVQINQSQIKRSEPNIKQIFGTVPVGNTAELEQIKNQMLGEMLLFGNTKKTNQGGDFMIDALNSLTITPVNGKIINVNKFQSDHKAEDINFLDMNLIAGQSNAFNIGNNHTYNNQYFQTNQSRQFQQQNGINLSSIHTQINANVNKQQRQQDQQQWEEGQWEQGVQQSHQVNYPVEQNVQNQLQRGDNQVIITKPQIYNEMQIFEVKPNTTTPFNNNQLLPFAFDINIDSFQFSNHNNSLQPHSVNTVQQNNKVQQNQIQNNNNNFQYQPSIQQSSSVQNQPFSFDYGNDFLEINQPAINKTDTNTNNFQFEDSSNTDKQTVQNEITNFPFQQSSTALNNQLFIQSSFPYKQDLTTKVTQNTQIPFTQEIRLSQNNIESKPIEIPSNQSKQIKPLRKLAKPPSTNHIQLERIKAYKQQQIQNNNLNQINNSQSQSNRLNQFKQQPIKIEKYHYYQHQTQPSIVNNKNVIEEHSNVFVQFKNQTVPEKVNPSFKKIVPSLNLNLNALRDTQKSAVSNSIEQPVKKQKIISTYNRHFTYSPRSSTNGKSHTFFMSSKTKNTQNNGFYSSTNIQQHSMIDSLTFGIKNESQYDQLRNSEGGKFKKNNKNNKKQLQLKSKKHVDNSLELGFNDILGQLQDSKSYQEDDIEQSLDQGFNSNQQSSNQPSNFNKKKSLYDSQKTQKRDVELQQKNRKLSVQMRQNLSKNLTMAIPPQAIKYLSEQIDKNKFFFDKLFYERLSKILNYLTCSDEIKQFNSRSGLSVSDNPFYNSEQKIFSEEVKFIQSIVSTLHKIDQLNKKFTIAMEEDQQQELAQVVVKSKQLCFQVNQDGQIVKDIAKTVIKNRLTGIKQQNKQQQLTQEQISAQQKYKGLYYLVSNLLTSYSPESQFAPQSIIESQYMTYLIEVYKRSGPTPSLQTKTQFLSLAIMLYILHIQLNQLQHIKNLSDKVFTYLSNQREIMMEKINQIRDEATRNNQSPQQVFQRLMETQQFPKYLRQLGQMATVTQRVMNLAKRLNILTHNEIKLTKTIAECRQLATKYNLLNQNQGKGSQIAFREYLSVILNGASNGKTEEQIYHEMKRVLNHRPICKICFVPKSDTDLKQKQGEFISNNIVSSEQIGQVNNYQTKSIEWCHLTCYSMLTKVLQQEIEH